MGAMLGAAGALYATNVELRTALPDKARGLPVAVGRGVGGAPGAGRGARRPVRPRSLGGWKSCVS